MTTFEVLAEPSRRRILDLLTLGEMPVGELVQRLSMSQPAVSKHLRVLRDAGLVSVRVDAQRRRYGLRATPLAEVDAWLEPFRRYWTKKLDALETHLATGGMTMDGTLQETKNGYVLRFERDLPHPIEKVWAALTDPDRLASWFCEPGAEVQQRVGGRVFLPGDDIDSTVTAIDPPRLIEYEWKTAKWDGGPIRWELSPTSDGGTHMVFTHIHPLEIDESIELPAEVRGTDPLARTLAGWHTLFELLSNTLDGKTEQFSMERWREHYERYNRKTA